MHTGIKEYPHEFTSRLIDQLGETASHMLFEALQSEKGTSIRVNPAKPFMSVDLYRKVEWCSTGYYLPERPQFTLDPHFHAGAYYVQESSSMFLEEVFRQVAGDNRNLNILDLCGAPGGKATHLASIAGPGSLVVTNEVVRQRAAVLAENISKWGTGNVMVTSNDPARFSQLPGFFDILVVDAPCSGEGMFRKNEVVNEWSLANTRLCSERQKRILIDSWDSLKGGGLLIYSTCTFNPEENERNIGWLHDKKGAESVRLEINPDWGIAEIEYRGIYGYGFYPGRVRGEGFFITVCRKPDETGYKPAGSGRIKTNISGKDRSIAGEWTSADPSGLFRLDNLLIYSATGLNILSILKSRLNIVKAGTAIATVKGSSYIPGHELALSTLLRREAFPVISVNLEEALGYLRRETLSFNSDAPGWNLVDYEGSVAGFVKNIGSRFNNYYPQEWRIRLQHKI
ncbi:MAG: rRNA methyltransferase [Bacteroidia bacterium]|nr:MAG: rRNA methyltransferase [Bacteroidia bacterium]